jgi:hypothetical protein
VFEDSKLFKGVRAAGGVTGLNAPKVEWQSMVTGKPGGRKCLREYMEQNVWPMMLPDQLGRVMSREEDRITMPARSNSGMK